MPPLVSFRMHRVLVENTLHLSLLSEATENRKQMVFLEGLLEELEEKMKNEEWAF